MVLCDLDQVIDESMLSKVGTTGTIALIKAVFGATTETPQESFVFVLVRKWSGFGRERVYPRR